MAQKAAGFRAENNKISANKNEENHRFSTLISSNLCLLLKGYCVYFTIPLFFIRLCLNATAPRFYSVTPK